MIKPTWRLAGLALPLILVACDSAPYDSSSHHHADASTGSMLPGVDAGTNANDGMGDTAVNTGLGKVAGY